MVSVAMALYNSKRFIEEQLDSIRNQTVPVDEVIMIDDGSTDGTVEWVNEYIKKHELKNWKIRCHEINMGYIKTFFDAVGECRGDIIILCDHDDVWVEDKVNIIKLQFDSKKEVLSLATSFLQIDAEGKTIDIRQKLNHSNNNLIRRKVNRRKLNKMSLKDVAVYNISPGCTCAVRSVLRDELLKFCNDNLPHDWKLNILAACRDGLYYLDIPTTKYRIYEKNTIGLGHVDDFTQRKKNVSKNYREKTEASHLLECCLGTMDKNYKYYKKVEKVFKFRDEYMSSLNIKYLINALISSFGMNKLYESIMMDYISSKRRTGK